MNVNRLSNATELEELIARVAMQDRSAFDRLYEITSPRLFAVAMRISRSQVEAEEICQDAFVRVWQRAETFRPSDANPLSWMTAITRNIAIDRIRRKKMPTVPVEMAESVPDETLSPEGAVGAAQTQAQIDVCLGELDASHAGAVRLAYIEGFSYKELAERYETPLNTMRTWLRRSLLRLRDCLEREGL